MLVRRKLRDGRQVTLAAAEVVVTDDFGQPLALTYEENGLVAHSDATKSDFNKTARRLGLNPPPVEICDLRGT